MAVLDAILAPSLAAPRLTGLEFELLDGVSSHRKKPTLLVYSIPGRAVTLGRYHLWDGASERGGVAIARRITGGRICGAGDGWLGIALVLPTRSSLLKEDRPLKPDQVMNRYARGLLNGLRAAGLDCFYPGRDAITFDRREIAMCTYETDASGAMLFEAALAMNRGLTDLVQDLERADPQSTLNCSMYGDETATTVAKELKREVPFDELADRIVAGFQDQLGKVERRELTPDEADRASRRALELDGVRWLNLMPLAGPTLTNRRSSQLGQVEVRLRIDAAGKIERAMLTGDFIANSPGIAEFENALVGDPPSVPVVSSVASKVFARGDNFILGISELGNLVRLVAEAR